jgi:BlaI family transcriptional regulator, penicillinase repressor
MSLKSPLSPLEQEVMQVVWSRGKTTAAEVQAALAPQRPLRDSTVRTLLMRLEEKGYLHHEVEGRTFVYASRKPPQSLAARAVQQIVDRFCQGSLESLLVGMVDDEIVDPEELQRIVERLNTQPSGKPRRFPRRKERPR